MPPLGWDKAPGRLRSARQYRFVGCPDLDCTRIAPKRYFPYSPSAVVAPVATTDSWGFPSWAPAVRSSQNPTGKYFLHPCPHLPVSSYCRLLHRRRISSVSSERQTP
uniref:(northern house mosquito) hypothetical protein n=1 Tax=Culex pipiens TaxID=7175 RepID=A0A8D8PJ96_CULPI